MHAISENIGLRTGALLLDREMNSLKKSLLSAMNMHTTNDFNIKTIDADLEFKYSQEYLLELINLIDKDSHLHLVERSMRTVKE